MTDPESIEVHDYSDVTAEHIEGAKAYLMASRAIFEAVDAPPEVKRWLDEVLFGDNERLWHKLIHQGLQLHIPESLKRRSP